MSLDPKEFLSQLEERRKAYEETTRFIKNQKDVEEYFEEPVAQALLEKGLNMVADKEKFFYWMASEMYALDFKAPIEVLLEGGNGYETMDKIMSMYEYGSYL